MASQPRVSKVLPLSEKELKTLRDAFELFNLNKDKEIDGAELGVILRSINRDFKTADVQQILTDEGTRTVTFEQLVKLVEKTRSLFTFFEMDDLESRIKEIRAGTMFLSSLSKHFPGALLESVFVKELDRICAQKGFTKDNTIAAVSTCRDEICKPLTEKLSKHWVGTFDLTSLAGMVFLGTTGLSAALHHAPQEKGRERYLFLALPHIAVDSFGEIGSIFRPGRIKRSNACGALCAFSAELESGRLKTGLDMDDLEYSLMKQRLIDHMEYGSKPSLVELTKITMQVIQEDLERLIKKKVDPKTADYVVCIGVQVHGPHWMNRTADMDYVWPNEVYAVVEGKRHNLSFELKKKDGVELFNPFTISETYDRAKLGDQAGKKEPPKESAVDVSAAKDKTHDGTGTTSETREELQPLIS